MAKKRSKNQPSIEHLKETLKIIAQRYAEYANLSHNQTEESRFDFYHVTKYLEAKQINIPNINDTFVYIRTLILNRILATQLQGDAQTKAYIRTNYDKLRAGEAYDKSKFESNEDTNHTAWRWIDYYTNSRLKSRIFSPIELDGNIQRVDKILCNINALLMDPIFNDNPDAKLDMQEHLVQQVSVLMRANYHFDTINGHDKPSCIPGSAKILVLVFQSHPAFRPKITQHQQIRKYTYNLIVNMAAAEMQSIAQGEETKQTKLQKMLQCCEALTCIGTHNVALIDTPEKITTTTTGKQVDNELIAFRSSIRNKYYPTSEELMHSVLKLMPEGTTILSIRDKQFIILQWYSIANSDIRSAIYEKFEELKKILLKSSPKLNLVKASLSSYINLTKSSMAHVFALQLKAVRTQFNSRLMDYLQELNDTQEFRFTKKKLKDFANTLDDQIKDLSVPELEDKINVTLNSQSSDVHNHKRQRRVIT